MNKITSRPPVKNTAKDFILGAEKRERKQENEVINNQKVLPWQAEGIRSDVQKVFTVKLPEEYTLKIKYASEKTNKSQQKIVREIICSKIDALLDNLGIE